MESIQDKINRFYEPLRAYEEGGPQTRYKSWEWCHKAFLEKKDEYRNATNDSQKEEIVDFLALHLAFYLASWGMYRGSTYLLERDYKAHKPAVRYILDEKYEILWDFNPNVSDPNQANSLLFGEAEGIYWLVKYSYKNYKGGEDDASETLTTKILMGSFGCIPAFDRFFKKGISTRKKVDPDCNSMTQTLETKKITTFLKLCGFANNHWSELTLLSDFSYPIMKCLDMYFWEVGYEMDLAKGLGSDTICDRKKRELLEDAKRLRLCSPATVSFNDAVCEILRKNGVEQL